MRRSMTSIVGLGIVTAIFMAIMSMFYLQQIPTSEDLDRLGDDVRREHGLYLSATSDVEVTLVRPQKTGDRTGVRVVCTLRPDIRRRPQTIGLYLGRIADTVLTHPDWGGKISFATVMHTPPVKAYVTRWAKGKEPKQAGQR